MKQFFLGVLVSTLSSAALANLVTNGSFEDGVNGWTLSGTQLSYLPTAIVTNGVTGSAFGEAIPAANTTTLSDDVAGNYGLYFVDDIAQQFLTQTIFLSVGSYAIGFDAYSPLNGWDNTFDATFSANIAGVELANYSVQANNAQEWVNYSGVANILAEGFYDVSFEFNAFGITGADVVIDRVYVLETEGGGGVDIPPVSVPEPSSLVLLGLGLLGLGISRKRVGKGSAK